MLIQICRKTDFFLYTFPDRLFLSLENLFLSEGIYTLIMGTLRMNGIGEFWKMGSS